MQEYDVVKRASPNYLWKNLSSGQLTLRGEGELSSLQKHAREATFLIKLMSS